MAARSIADSRSGVHVSRLIGASAVSNDRPPGARDGWSSTDLPRVRKNWRLRRRREGTSQPLVGANQSVKVFGAGSAIFAESVRKSWLPLERPTRASLAPRRRSRQSLVSEIDPSAAIKPAQNNRKVVHNFRRNRGAIPDRQSPCQRGSAMRVGALRANCRFCPGRVLRRRIGSALEDRQDALAELPGQDSPERTARCDPRRGLAGALTLWGGGRTVTEGEPATTLTIPQ